MWEGWVRGAKYPLKGTDNKELRPKTVMVMVSSRNWKAHEDSEKAQAGDRNYPGSQESQNLTLVKHSELFSDSNKATV